MTCRSACMSRNHATYGECLQSADLQLVVGESKAKAAKWDDDLAAYRAARRDGIQPPSTMRADVDNAVELSRIADAPFDATDGSFHA